MVQFFHFQNNLAGCRRRDFRLLNLMQVRSAKSQCLDFLISQSFHLLCGKFPHNFSFLHTQEAVCQIHQIIKPMFCYDNGFSLLFQIADNVRKAISRCNIQIGGWFIHDILYCKQLGINYKNLSEEEFRWFIRILKKSKKMGTPISQRKKR